MAKTKVKTRGLTDLNVTNAKIAAGTIDVTSKITGVVPAANLGTGTASSSTVLYGDGTFKSEPTYDDNQVQSNIAMLGFKVAINGSLARYNLVDQSIDEYEDTSGVDASASTNERREGSAGAYYYEGTTSSTPTVTEDADVTGTDGDYSWYKWTSTGAGSYVNASTQDHEWLIVAGGGAGGNGHSASGHAGGGGGAGGYRTGASLSLTGGNTYTPTVGAGGTPVALDSSSSAGDGGNSSLAGTGITTITSTGGGGGGVRNATDESGQDGGSGGGGASSSNGGSATSITPITGETTTIQGYAGGTADGSGGSGGGHGAAGTTSGTNAGAVGGVGTANDIIETGTDVYYAGGGAGGSSETNTTQAAGGNGGGGAGGGAYVDNAVAGTANTGGGGGAGGRDEVGKAGGTGIVILRRLTSIVASGGDLTLQSTDVTATAEPDYGEFVTLIENAYGTATLNTDIKGYVSRDSGTTFTQGTLVDEGSWGTNKKVLGFHDLDISAQPSGTSMCYKITTHNQVASSLETRIYATSIGWR